MLAFDTPLACFVDALDTAVPIVSRFKKPVTRYIPLQH